MFGSNTLGSTPYGAGGQQTNTDGFTLDGKAYVQVRSESLLYDRYESGFLIKHGFNAIPEKGYDSITTETGLVSLLKFDTNSGSAPIEKVSNQPVTVNGTRNTLIGRWKYAESLESVSFGLPDITSIVDEWTILLTIRPELQYIFGSDGNSPQWKNYHIIARIGDYCLVFFRSEYQLIKLVDPNFDVNATQLSYLNIAGTIFSFNTCDYKLTLPDSHPNQYAMNRFDWHHLVISKRKTNQNIPTNHNNQFEIFAGVMSPSGSFYTMLEHGSSFGNFVKSKRYDENYQFKAQLSDGVTPAKVNIGSTFNLKSVELDEIAIFNRELTSIDFENLYRNGLLSPVLSEDIIELAKSEELFYKHELISSTLINAKNEVISSYDIEISYSSIDVINSIQSEYSINDFDEVVNFITDEYGNELINSVEDEIGYSSYIINSVNLEFTYKEPVINSIESEYSFLPNDVVIMSITDYISYAPETSTVAITNDPKVIIGGNPINIIEGNVQTSEGAFVWTCSLTLGDYEHYDLFQKENDFRVVIGPDEYAMILHKKSRLHSSPAGHRYTIEGYSPTIRHKIPYKRPSDNLYENVITTKAVAEEVDPNIDFRIMNWTIPANSLSVKNGTKLQALSKLAAAIGATLETTIDGQLYCRYLFPVSPQNWANSPTEYYLGQYDYLHSLQNDSEITEYEDCINIASSNQATLADSMEFEDTGNHCGIISVFLNPIRPVKLVHTSTNVSIQKIFEGEEETCEVVEFKQKTGNTKRMVSQFVNYEWLTQDLGAVQSDGKILTATTEGGYDGYSLLEITYKYHVIKYKVCGNIDPVQFLLVDDN